VIIKGAESMRAFRKMTSFSTIISSLAIGFMFNTSAIAESYGVQVGAFGKVSPSYVQKMEAYAPVYTEDHNGVTRVILGDFSTKSEAQSLLNTIRASGLSDAYIRRKSPNSAQQVGIRTAPTPTATAVKKAPSVQRTVKAPAKTPIKTSIKEKIKEPVKASIQSPDDIPASYWVTEDLLPATTKSTAPASKRPQAPAARPTATKVQAKPAVVKSLESAKASISDKHDDHGHTHFKPHEAAKWENLTDEQRRNTVYLDGELHLKEGDKFIPIQ